MPKVTDEYLAGKKNDILECTEEILKEKPLYAVTMRDIIKKAGYSQGVIYRYYANLDEIYVDYINKHTLCHSLEERIDALLCSDLSEKIVLMECLTAMGNYIEELLSSVVGKAFFELTVLYAYDYEKRSTIFPKLRFKQSLEYAQLRIVEYALSNVERGVFKPKIPVHSIVMFVSCAIDGIAQSVSIHSTQSNKGSIEPDTDIPELFQTLAKAVIHFLEA